MQTAKATGIIDTRLENAWRSIDDFGNIADFHPHLISSHIVGEQTSGEGTQRVCRFETGGEIRERVTRYLPGRGYSVTIEDTGSFPISTGIARLYLAPTDDGRTRVDFSLQFLPKFGPIGSVLGRFVMKPRFERVLRDVIRGLEQHATEPMRHAA